MRIYNHSSLPDQEVRELAKFAARGICDREILVEIVDDPRRNWSGVAWNIGTNRPDIFHTNLPSRYVDRYWKGGRHQQYRYFILLRVCAEDVQSAWLMRHFWLQKKYPDGIPMETWQDNFIMLLAHELRHVWQFARNRRLRIAGKKQKNATETDADKHAIRIYNLWREQTGRQLIENIKLPSPFRRLEQAA